MKRVASIDLVNKSINSALHSKQLVLCFKTALYSN